MFSRVLFVCNPISGGDKKESFMASLEDYCQKKGINYAIYTTEGREDHKKIKVFMDDFEPEVVVAIGGDGTVTLVASILLHTGIPLGIIPFGSANGMAEELSINSNRLQALSDIFSAEVRSIDVLLVNGAHYCLHIGDIGLNAKVVKRFEEERTRGWLGYIKQFFRELPISRHTRFQIQTDKELLVKRAHMVAFANARKYGSGALLNPAGQLDDGEFELVIIRSLSFTALFYLLISGFSGKRFQNSYARTLSCKEASIEVRSGKKLPLQVDGEVIEDCSKVHVRILPKCLRIVVPNTPGTGLFKSFLGAVTFSEAKK